MVRKQSVCVAMSAAVGWVAFSRLPFPGDNVLLQLVWLEQPSIFYGVKFTYLTMLFTTPYIALSILFSLSYIFLVRPSKAPALP